MPNTVPTPVEVVSPVPIPVEVVKDRTATPTTNSKSPFPIQNQNTDPSKPADTTFQQDLTTAGQRHVNLIWESTQGSIAKFVILGTMLIDGVAVLLSIGIGKDFTAAQALAVGFVNSLATGVVSFYFSRTNHTQIGGVGSKPNEEYQGR